MTTPFKHSKELETLINTISSKVKDLEAEFKKLGEELDKERAVATGPGLPPYIFVERAGHTGHPLIVSRKAVESCHNRLMFFSRMTDALELNATHSVVHEKTGEVVRYTPIKVFARFDSGAKAQTMFTDDWPWHEIATRWDESFLDIVSIATGLKVEEVVVY